MKATGIVRKIDELGRIVIPKETRDILGLGVGTPMEFYTDKGNIIIRKYAIDRTCSECEEVVELVSTKSRICKSCASKLANY